LGAVGDEESIPEIFRFFEFFLFFEIFEPPQNAWDKNFRNECKWHPRDGFGNQNQNLAGLVRNGAPIDE
jgi:hypothetical protein